jgi:hypothetical protein
MGPVNGRNGAATNTRVLPGPNLKLDEPMPCGCRVSKDPNGKLRLWFCRTHLAAFETLDALQTAARALDRLNTSDGELEDVRFAVRAAIHKARSREPW